MGYRSIRIFVAVPLRFWKGGGGVDVVNYYDECEGKWSMTAGQTSLPTEQKQRE